MYLVCAFMYFNFMSHLNHFGCCSKESRRVFAKKKKLSMVCDLKSLLVFSENADAFRKLANIDKDLVQARAC